MSLVYALMASVFAGLAVLFPTGPQAAVNAGVAMFLALTTIRLLLSGGRR